MRADESGRRTEARFLAVASASVVVATIIVPATSGLWLDELLTWWVVKDGLGDAVQRALTDHVQSPAYYVIAWVTKEIVGKHEFLLRIPSLLAAAAAIWAFFRLVHRCIDADAARYAAFGLIAMQTVEFASSDFRPYAFALLFCIASTSVFVRWIDDGSFRRGAWYVVLAVATVWFHYLFATILVAHAVYATVRIRQRRSPLDLRGPVLALLGVVLGVAPLAVQLADLWGRRATLTLAGMTVTDRLAILAPPAFAGAAVLGLALARMLGPVSVRVAPSRNGAALLFWSWLLFPAGVLFAAGVTGIVDLGQPRYYLASAPAAAGLFGWGLRSLDPALVRRVVLGVLAILAVLIGGTRMKGFEDWRSLATAERRIADPDSLVLFHSGLIESADLTAFNDPRRRAYLLAPAAFYAFEGRLEPLPYNLDHGGADYVDALLARELGSADRFYLVTRALAPYAVRLSALFEPRGWSADVVGSYGTIYLVAFTKDEPVPG